MEIISVLPLRPLRLCGLSEELTAEAQRTQGSRRDDCGEENDGND